MLSLTTAVAQIGNLGIYGSAPTPASTPCGTPRYAQLHLYPATGDDLLGWSQTIPLNGLKNFNFYYTADGTGFLSGGGYQVTYLNTSQENCYGVVDVVSYSPNRAHTNGVQVRPFNSTSNPTPLGIHGIILAKIPGGGGATAPLENAIASVGTGNLHKAKTNGVGYFSIYYSTIYGTEGGFLPSSYAYYTHISGVYNNCPYTWDDPLGSIYYIIGWLPDDPRFYVQGTSIDIGTITISSSSTSPACQP